MKKVYTIIAWILGILMTFFAVIVLIVAPIWTALLVIGSFGFLMFGLIMSIKRMDKKPATQETSSPMLSRLQFHSGNGIQLLESLYLIENTSNIKTLDGRIEFALQLYDRFVVNSGFANYEGLINKDIDAYTSMYYDRPVSEEQMRLITIPNKAELLNYISQCIYGGYIRYADFQIEQISRLVKQTAIDRRYNNLLALSSEYVELYGKYDIPELGNIERIESYANSHQPVK